MKQQTLVLIEELQADGQDYEWYPTPSRIVSAIAKDINIIKPQGNLSILDVGAGDGRVLLQLSEETDADKLLAMEKATAHIRRLSPLAFIVGTDFEKQSLIDKSATVTFCNPPYSKYERWAEKVIRETQSKACYLVLPQRWACSKVIDAALKFRDAKVHVVACDSFSSADRPARAVVEVLRVSFEKNNAESDPFTAFFNETFKDTIDRFLSFGQDENTSAAKETDITPGVDLPKRLVLMYENEIEYIKSQYSKLGTLDVGLMKELGVDLSTIKGALRQRLGGLKIHYWKMLLDNARVVTERLSSKYRNLMTEKMAGRGTVDFTVENIHAILLWVIENASKYIDAQLVETYEKLIDDGNCRNYKSNEKVMKFNRWRYNDEQPTHFYLDFRLVIGGYYGCETHFSYGTQNTYPMYSSGRDLLMDLLTVARTLGYDVETNDPRVYHNYYWKPGESEEFTELDGSVLFEIKAFKNANMHIRLSQSLARKLNVEFGRIKGWIHNSTSASSELNDNEASSVYGILDALKIANTSQMLLS